MDYTITLTDTEKKSMEYVALDVALLKKDKKRILDIIKEAEDLYDFKHEEELLSPSGYGLVYIDLVKDVMT